MSISWGIKNKNTQENMEQTALCGCQLQGAAAHAAGREQQQVGGV